MAQSLIDPNALQALQMIFFVLRRAMSDGGITIKTAELSGVLGLTLFGSRVILMDPRQSPEQWRCTLLHELIHLSRGPVAPEQAAAEEDIVSHLAALLLIPDSTQLAEFDWTLEGMRELARQRGVDVETVEAALNPPTMPLRALVRPAFVPVDALTSHSGAPQESAQDDFALAARARPAADQPTHRWREKSIPQPIRRPTTR